MKRGSDMTAHLRPVQTDGQPTFGLTQQPAPMLDWLAIANLRMDDRYQRPLGQHNWQAIRKIAQRFDWCAFSPVLVAPLEGGLYAVIDGQHRVHAAALAGIQQVPAMIVQVARAHQALAFVKVNSGIRVSPHQTYRAELAAHHREALAIAAAAQAAGCTVPTSHPSSKNKKPREIYCIGFLRTCIRAGHAPYLTAALQALVAFDTKGRVGLYNDFVLGPFVNAAVQTGVTNTAHLTAALHLRDPFHVLEAAAATAKTKGLFATAEKRKAMARQILAVTK